MIKKIEIEAKNLAEAEQIAQEKLNASLDHIKITVIREKKGILGIGSSTIFEAALDINFAFEGKKFLEDIFASLNIEVSTEFRQRNEGLEIYYQIQSDENALIIGSEGRTLNAIQMLLRAYINKLSPRPIRVSLDIGGYKANRRKQLEILATKTAKEVAYTGVEIKLEPMNSYERRIIHTKLYDWRDVYTESVGEDEQRAVVIKPKNK